MPVELYPDQQEALNSILTVYKEQPQGGKALVVACTGYGKTILFSSLARGLQGKSVLIIAHRDELLNQAREKLQMVDGSAIVGKVGGGTHEYGLPLTVAGIDTISHPNHISNLHRFHYDVVIWDECFPAGTLIEGKPIEQIKTGDTVTAFNEHTGIFAQKEVTQTFRRPVGPRLFKITSGRHVVVCTPNHPFYTPSGWKTAGELSIEENILRVKTYQDTDQCELHRLQATIYNHTEMEKRPIQSHGTGVLLPGMRQESSLAMLVDNNGVYQQKIRFCQDENQQPYEERTSPSQGQRVFTGNRTQTPFARGEWKRPNTSTATTSRSVGLETNGICCENQDTKGQFTTYSNSLQDRYSFSLAHDSNRNRRSLSPVFNQAGAGSEKNTISYWSRVDSIEIYEQGSEGTFGGLCPDGYVYNFEVNGYHTYTANGFVVHNCHHCCAPKYAKVRAMLPDAFHLGVTATPDRLDNKSLEPLFGTPIFSMNIVEAVQKQRLCDVRAIAIRTETNLDAIRSSKNSEGETDFNQRELEEAIDTPERNRRVVEAYQEHASGRRSICFCVSVEHAQSLAYSFNDNGIDAAIVSGDTPLEERNRLYNKLRTGELQVLTNVQVLTEGFDLAQISCVIMARPTQSRSLYTQCIGRGMRLAPAKKDCLILDLTDNSQRLRLTPQSLRSAIDLHIHDNEPLSGAITRIEEEEAQEKRALIRKLNEKRTRDIVVNLFGLPEWVERPGGLFVLEVGARKHRIALVPRADGFYDVQARLAPAYSGQTWMTARPLDWCMQHAEKKARQLLEEPHAEKLVDRNATWRDKPVDPQGNQVKFLRWKKIPVHEGMTKGEASDAIDAWEEQDAAKKQAKAERQKARMQA